MGRKATSTNKNYFTEKEEKAILDFINSDDQDFRENLFSTIIYPTFTTMVESIIRRYKLYPPDEHYDETFCDVLSFIITKLDKFKPGTHKAYSYYGTICKNYLIGKIQSFNKIQERNPTYENVQGGFNNLKYSDYNIENNGVASEIIKKLTKKIKNMVENYEDFSLKDCEIKLGKALINLFENWDYILTTNGSPKLNKSAILFFSQPDL